MIERDFNWRNREIRQHVAVVDGLEQPTLILKNGTYLNVFTKEWLQGNIWIYNDRIIYVGQKMPEHTERTEIVDCEGKYLVPGYIEPHFHPFQLSNLEEIAWHAALNGTTTLVNDPLILHFLMDKKKAFSLVDRFRKIPISMYWWARFDSQTALQEEEDYFNTEEVLSWLSHPAVLVGGELSSWPSLLEGDDRVLYWIQESKLRGKPVEGHFPGASERTLTKMKLLGANGDHESISGEEVIRRVRLGYFTPLRHSSIRPDLPNLIDELHELGFSNYEHLAFTTDGATPAFIEKGIINQCIEIAIEKGIPPHEAYGIATYNAARQFRKDDHLGSIAPGRLAHINILTEKTNPHPESVLAKGRWIKQADEEKERGFSIDWEKYNVQPLSLDWKLTMGDLQFSIPVGLDMVTDVIVKPYAINTDITVEKLPSTKNDAFLLLIDKKGKWRVNTTVRNFTKSLGGMASSFSASGDLLMIGKSKRDMMLAWKRMKEIGGGIVLAHEGEVLLEIPLTLGGLMSNQTIDKVIEKEKKLTAIFKEHGYQFHDPIYSILFLTIAHLPYIRITQQGIIDIMKREILFPATMR
jgi:adenine deaminase